MDRPLAVRNLRLSFRQRERRGTDAAESMRSPGHPLLRLPRAIGNQAVQHMVRACFVQMDSASGRHEDAYEREADFVAEQAVADRPASQRSTGDGGGVSDSPAAVNQVMGSSGQPLDPSSREFFESRLGHDFSEVRIHGDARAAASARALDAQAYTVGRDIVFGEGQYAPQTEAGRRLLAHELTHVVQQRTITGTAAAPIVQRQKSPFGKVTTFQMVDYRAEDLVDAALAQSKVLWPYIGSKVEAGTRMESGGGVSFLPRKAFEEKYIADAHRSAEAIEEAKNVGGYYDRKENKIILAIPATLESMLHEAIHKLADRSFQYVFASLDEGVTQLFTNAVLQEFGLERGKAYPKQVVAAQALCGVVGLLDLGLGYFLGPGNYVLNVLMTKVPGLDPNVFLSALRAKEVDWQRVVEMLQGRGTQGPKP